MSKRSTTPRIPGQSQEPYATGTISFADNEGNLKVEKIAAERLKNLKLNGLENLVEGIHKIDEKDVGTLKKEAELENQQREKAWVGEGAFGTVTLVENPSSKIFSKLKKGRTNKDEKQKFPICVKKCFYRGSN